ncbi:MULTISPECIES: acyltransferase [Rhodococcus]|uniref:DapH/DapD/GlmU-related protein n=1 Tax=Rhodococcus oxybenzonivorans TaxID=1990687 RepID=A0AAE4V3P6_9NOCA|nr:MULTISPECIES: DapH/DapD/GlmU-related protein [Rhodococcus]MDV7243720.1 DapH/DapD/GlmU-related protein [Rhodococcus oxybenzonivorans]MDV7267194.1 DapH/DapD/GlmU-related protein [Rhodococcus oxybenzonivorans]MDV7275038.1 DapH/DapD/GlmU-related protein [Rhodococcus oxybenzonivorans]MDV7335276.1 DapH/DapD/GlmU-related protein [Rhodococcus oxybenzonivorans]MDV7345987.1 DapH/DapD/GlmU-related protein [Rhodococcus oxybenzonivorans]
MTEPRKYIDQKMMKSAQRLLEASGRRYPISDQLPAEYLFSEILLRATQAVRGGLRFRRISFVGRRVQVRGKRQLSVGRGVSIGDDTTIDARSIMGVTLRAGSRLGRRGIITSTSHLSLMGKGVEIGQRSGIGDFFHLGASGGVRIGDDVIIGPYFVVHSQEHRYESPDRPIREQGTIQLPVEIGDNCWIGSRVTLLAGTKIGPRTVVASGAVVRGEHAGNEILAGIPARSVRAI